MRDWIMHTMRDTDRAGDLGWDIWSDDVMKTDTNETDCWAENGLLNMCVFITLFTYTFSNNFRNRFSVSGRYNMLGGGVWQAIAVEL